MFDRVRPFLWSLYLLATCWRLCEYQPLPSRLKFHLLQLQRILRSSQICVAPTPSWAAEKSQPRHVPSRTKFLDSCPKHLKRDLRGEGNQPTWASLWSETAKSQLRFATLDTVGCLKFPTHEATGMDVMTNSFRSNAPVDFRKLYAYMHSFIHMCVCVHLGKV